MHSVEYIEDRSREAGPYKCLPALSSFPVLGFINRQRMFHNSHRLSTKKEETIIMLLHYLTGRNCICFEGCANSSLAHEGKLPILSRAKSLQLRTERMRKLWNWPTLIHKRRCRQEGISVDK